MKKLGSFLNRYPKMKMVSKIVNSDCLEMEMTQDQFKEVSIQNRSKSSSCFNRDAWMLKAPLNFRDQRIELPAFVEKKSLTKRSPRAVLAKRTPRV